MMAQGSMDEDFSTYSREELEAMLREARGDAPSQGTARPSSLPSDEAMQAAIRDQFAQLTLAPDAVTLLTNYLLAFREDRLHLALGQLDTWQAVASREQQLELPEIYTELRTTFVVQQAHDRTRLESFETNEREPLSAPAFASAYPKAVLLGDPGSGKSTFASMLALCLAGEILRDTEINLGRVPDWTNPPVPGWKKQPRKLLPLFLTLREYAGSGKPIWNFLADRLDTSHGPNTAAAIESVLKKDGGLLIVDGLDEVPDAKNARSGIVEAVHAFATRFPQCQILVTSRPYAYEHDGWELKKGFTSAQLAPFDEHQRSRFLERWYAHAAPKKGVSPADCEQRRDSLRAHIEAQDHLRDLAEVPLLLTLVCLLDLHTGGAVPQNREELYDKSVELLLESWQQPKLDAPTLQAYLGVTRDELLRCIEAIAFRFHDEQGHAPGLADIPDGDVLSALRELAKSKSGETASTDSLADYLENRAGLLNHHGSIYRFPHRSFQEYLAARHLSDLDDSRIVAHVRSEPRIKWREPFLLAGAKIRKSRVPAVWSMICTVLDSLPSSSSEFTDTDWRIIALLGRLVHEIRIHDDETALNSDQRGNLKRIRNLNAELVTNPSQPLPLIERLHAGIVLGNIGDPRSGVGCRDDGVPDILWVRVPDGEFVSGAGGTSIRRTIDKPFAIARYPITNAQYNAFVADGGYSDPQWWSGKAPPDRKDSDFDDESSPRVSVSWYEANAFCRWLSGKIGKPVSMPSHAQWERSYRGANWRRFPWGDSLTDTDRRSNVRESHLDRPSPVGLFPMGAAFEDDKPIDDMAGNVWEWIDEPTEDDNDEKSMVGGSYSAFSNQSDRWGVRARPSHRSPGIGFRLVCL